MVIIIAKLTKELTKFAQSCADFTKDRCRRLDISVMEELKISDNTSKDERLRLFVKYAHDKGYIKGEKGHDKMESIFKKLGYGPSGKYTLEEIAKREEEEKNKVYEKIVENRKRLKNKLKQKKAEIEQQMERLDNLDLDSITEEIERRKAKKIRKQAESSVLEAQNKIMDKISRIEESVEENIQHSYDKLSDLTVNELRSLARSREIEYSDLNKKQLISTLMEA